MVVHGDSDILKINEEEEEKSQGDDNSEKRMHIPLKDGEIKDDEEEEKEMISKERNSSNNPINSDDTLKHQSSTNLVFRVEDERRPVTENEAGRRNTGPMGDRAKKEDICVICHQEDFSENNQIVYCDGCNLGFHQHCYNIPIIPPDNWYCDYCRIADACEDQDEDEPLPSCQLCHQYGGGLITLIIDHVQGSDEGKRRGTMKSLSQSLFVHKTCAIAAASHQEVVHGKVRFIAGRNGQVALLSSSSSFLLSKEDVVKTKVSEEKGKETARAHCSICDKAFGVLLPCMNPPTYDKKKSSKKRKKKQHCVARTHVSCAFANKRACIAVDRQEATILTWCSQHNPPMEQGLMNVGQSAVAKAIGLINNNNNNEEEDDNGGADAKQQEEDGDGHRLLRPFLGGYLDDKYNILQKAAEEMISHSNNNNNNNFSSSLGRGEGRNEQLILCPLGEGEMFALRRKM